jgi:hypothetical protein
MRRRGIGRAGRPGLVRTAATTAVVAGTATAVSGKVAQNQQVRAAQAAQPAPPPEPAPAPAATAADPMVEQLTQLAALKDQGILTEDEFAAKKAKILGI